MTKSPSIDEMVRFLLEHIQDAFGKEMKISAATVYRSIPGLAETDLPDLLLAVEEAFNVSFHPDWVDLLEHDFSLNADTELTIGDLAERIVGEIKHPASRSRE